MTAETPLPLAGIRVLELGSLIAGPYASALFAQFGAEVIEVEPPGTGDPLRKWRRLEDGTSLWWYVQSRNKKSVVIDLASAEGQASQRLPKRWAVCATSPAFPIGRRCAPGSVSAIRSPRSTPRSAR